MHECSGTPYTYLVAAGAIAPLTEARLLAVPALPLLVERKAQKDRLSLVPGGRRLRYALHLVYVLETNDSQLNFG
jgi:hypothetical protein